MLWDLLKSGDVPIGELPQLVLKALGYFQESSGFRDLMLGLFTADKELFAGKYGPAIKAAAEQRNLGQFISDVDLNKEIPQLEGTEGSGSFPISSAPEEKKEDKGNENPFNKCGSIGGKSAGGGIALLLLALLTPLILRLRKPVPVPVRVPVRNRRK